jgi:hypothetical protein
MQPSYTNFMTTLNFDYGSKTVQDFVFLYEHGQLNLEPGFQRKSVWTTPDRQKLVESICTNRPIPSVFLYKSTDNRGRLKYDVIDGKQRLESLLLFQGARGFRGERFDVRMQLGRDEDPKLYNWPRMRRVGLEHLLMGYKVQTVEVAGDLADIIDLFVRINSTGKRLTGAEKRHAKFYHSPFLRHAGKLAERRRDYIRHTGIMSDGQIRRMKHVELVSELLASIVASGLINKKTALDNIIGGNTVPLRTLQKAEREFTSTFNRLARMFPRLGETRLKNSADYYSLFMLIWKLGSNGAVLSDIKRNRHAEALLVRLSTGVDQVRTQVRRAEGARPDQRIYADYLLTVQGDTDSLATRQRREALLEQLLAGIFERRDERRGFSREQRRILWHSGLDQRCRSCHTKLSWTNFTADHVKPHSKGGRTALENAVLLCRSCNSRKGNRRSTRHKQTVVRK